MPIDPRLRSTSVTTPRTTGPTVPARPPAPPPAAPAPLAPAPRDGFDPGGARGTTPVRPRPGFSVNGTADDSTGVGDASGGRKPKTGTADDSTGLGDDSGGRKPKAGTADDSTGRKPQTGTADDSTGDRFAFGALVGPVTDPRILTLRENAAERLETPSVPSAGDQIPLFPPDLKPFTQDFVALLGANAMQSLLMRAKADPVTGQRAFDLLHATQGLPQADRSALLKLVCRDPKSALARVSDFVTRDPEIFGKMGVADRTALVQVLAKLDDRSLRTFSALAEHVPAALTQKDSKGQSFIKNLADLVGQPLNTALYGKTTKADIIDDVLRMSVNPERIDQGRAPTCTVTSMQYELVRDDPSEFTRLIAGLTGPTGNATMRGGGVLALETHSTAPKALQGRSVADGIFQAAAMEFGNGADPYDALNTVTRTDGGQTYGGLFPDQQRATLKALFGVKYQSKEFVTEEMGAAALKELKASHSFANFEQRNRPILMDINQGEVNHAVVFDFAQAGHVYFHDPYGVARVMTDEAFIKNVVAIHQPIES